MLYNSLILPHLNYGILSWGSSNSFCIKRLEDLQKRALRIIGNASFNAHHEAICKKLSLLKFNDLLSLKASLLFFDSQRTSLPEPLQSILKLKSNVHGINTRSIYNAFLPLL